MYKISSGDSILGLKLRHDAKYVTVPYYSGDYMAVMRQEEYDFLKIVLATNNPSYAREKSGITRMVHECLVNDPSFKELLHEYIDAMIAEKRLNRGYLLSRADKILHGADKVEKMPVIKTLWDMVVKGTAAGKVKLPDDSGKIEFEMPKIGRPKAAPVNEPEQTEDTDNA